MIKKPLIVLVSVVLVVFGLVYRRQTLAPNLPTQNDIQHLHDIENQTLSTGPATLALLGAPGPNRVVAATVNYGSGHMGYLAQPRDIKNAPALIVVHEWRGLNDHIKDASNLLASFGYQVLAVDLYDGSVATEPKEALGFVQNLDQAAALRNMQDAYSYLKSLNPKHIGAIGWCFGGGQALNLAIHQTGLDALVVYYGQVQLDTGLLQGLQAPILGHFGAADQSIKPESVEKFETLLNVLGKQNDIRIYSGASHAFANPTGNTWSPAAAQQARKKTLEFLSQKLL